MKTFNRSMVIAALLATSGFAFAQTSAPMAGTAGGIGPTAAEKAAPDQCPRRVQKSSQESTLIPPSPAPTAALVPRPAPQ